ncbi:uncharacterized protein LOC131884034 [Tigriopus californicus]|nr:uncharacterized protein LOC131884034 [Tigriopus californicus]
MNLLHHLTMMVFVALIYPCICKPFRLHTDQQHIRRHRARRSLSQIGGHRSIFTELWGVDTEWSQSLGNPCFSRPNELENAEEIDALGINGREHEINLQSASLLSHLRALEPQMSLNECSDQSLQNTPDLPNEEDFAPRGNFSTAVLAKVYNSFYFLSSQFRIMHLDWAHGKSCSRFRETLVPKFLRMARAFRDGMCSLLNPGHAQLAPYPSDELLEEHEKALNRAIYHYHDCSGRSNRDCIVVAYGKKLVEAIQSHTQQI